jgi:hypothetical protein
MVSLSKMEVSTMFIVWLAIMGLVVGAITAVILWRIGQQTGRWSTRRDMLFVAGTTLLGGIVFSTILGWIGYLLLGESGALWVGLIGGIIAVVGVLAWSTRSAHSRANQGRGLAPTRPTEGEAATRTPTPQ